MKLSPAVLAMSALLVSSTARAGDPHKLVGAPGILWKDANGTAVSTGVTGTITNQLYYFDDQGYVWNLTTNDAQISPIFQASVAFPTPDCTGPGYIMVGPLPRLTLKIDSESTYRAFPDTALPMETVNYGSSRNADGSCVTIDPGSEFSGVPVSATIGGLSLPNPGYVAPFHPELVR